MKRSASSKLVVAACACLGLASCQDFFSSSPLSALLGRDGYPDFDGMGLDAKLAVGEKAIANGNADLAAELLPSLLADYPGAEAAVKGAALETIVQLAILTTNISRAVAGAMKVLPAGDAEMTEEQAAALERCMNEVVIVPDADATFDLLSASGERAVSGGNYFFSGLALIQSIVRGQPVIDIMDLSEGEIATLIQGETLAAIGSARLLEEGCDQELIDSLGSFAGE